MLVVCDVYSRWVPATSAVAQSNVKSPIVLTGTSAPQYSTNRAPNVLLEFATSVELEAHNLIQSPRVILFKPLKRVRIVTPARAMKRSSAVEPASGTCIVQEPGKPA